MKAYMQKTKMTMNNWKISFIDFFTNITFWIDSKTNPIFGGHMYRISKFGAKFMTWIALPVIVITLASLYAATGFNGGNWGMAGGSSAYIATITAGVWAGVTGLFYILWFWFSKFGPETK